MTLEKAIYIVEGEKNVSIHPWTRKGWFYYWDEEDQKRHYTSKKWLIEAANWFVEDRLKNDDKDLDAEWEEHLLWKEMCEARKKAKELEKTGEAN